MSGRRDGNQGTCFLVLTDSPSGADFDARIGVPNRASGTYNFPTGEDSESIYNPYGIPVAVDDIVICQFHSDLSRWVLYHGPCPPPP